MAPAKAGAILMKIAEGLLLCRFRFGRVRLRELAAEPVDAACGVDQLLLAGEERVAGGADFEDDVALVGGTRLEDGSAGALYVDVFILRVNPLLRHLEYPLSGGRLAVRLRTGLVTVTSKCLSRY